MTLIERTLWRLHNIARMTAARREMRDWLVALVFFGVGLLILLAAEAR
jgi:hypothetical protein